MYDMVAFDRLVEELDPVYADQTLHPNPSFHMVSRSFVLFFLQVTPSFFFVPKLHFRFLIFVILATVRVNKPKAKSRAVVLFDILRSGITPAPKDVFQWPGSIQLAAIGTFAVLASGHTESVAVYDYVLTSIEGKPFFQL